MTLTSTQIRQLRHEFRQSKQHRDLGSVSLVADSENKTVLFNVAGMQQLVPYLMGKPHPLGQRVYNIQRCIRTNDIDDIGDERHCSMFEMMGNWSLGDYFKQNSIERTIEFLNQKLGIPLDRLGVTIFGGDVATGIPRDEESYRVATGLGIKFIKEMTFDENGDCDNFWTPGPVGPCGPCAEVYFDRGDSYGPSDWDMGVNDRYTEIRNNVFMAYYRDGTGKLSQLTQHNVDTGMGFERLCMLMQGTDTIFETDVFMPLIEYIEAVTSTSYQTQGISYRIIVDHLRASVFLLSDGVKPSNEGRGYILRRLIRRAVYHLNLLHSTSTKDMLEGIFNKFISHYVNRYPHLSQASFEQFYNETNRFLVTLSNGRSHLLGELDIINKSNKNLLLGDIVFKLYDTYGFPTELTREICSSYGVQIDREGFEKASQNAKSLSRSNQSFQKTVDRSSYLVGVPETKFVGHDLMCLDNFKILKEFEYENRTVFIFKETVFYPEMGGQIGDYGVLHLDDGRVYSIDVTQKYAGVILHFAKQM